MPFDPDAFLAAPAPAPAAAAPSGGFDPDAFLAAPAAAPAAPPKRSFLAEAGSRAVAPFTAAADVVKNATAPTSLADVGARLKQNLPEVGDALLSPVRAVGHALGAVGNAIVHPVDTFGGGNAPAVGRELLRGVNDNIPLANLAVERLGGPAEMSEEDAARAPGFRELGGFTGAPLVSRAFGGVSEAAGAAREKVGAKVRAKAVEGDLKRSVSNIVGNDPAAKAAIPTDVRKMGKAAGPIRDELLTDDGRAIADTARLEPAKGAELAKRKIAEVTTDRAADAAIVDQASMRGGVRAGDLVKHLEDSAEKLTDTGHGKDAAVANELRKAADRIKNAGEWGAKRVTSAVSPETPYDANFTVGQYRQLMAKVGRAEQAEADIAAKFPPKPGQKTFDPETIVPMLKLRDFVTDLQSTAYDGLGGINGTNAFEKAQQVARVGKDFLDEHLDAAAKADPKAREAVDRIREMNRRVNALATIRDTLERRAESEARAVAKTSPTERLENAAAGAALVASHGTALPMVIAGKVAAKFGPKALRAADRAVVRKLATSGPPAPAGPAPGIVVPLAAARAGNEQALEDLMARADDGDAQAAAKLAALTQRAPMLAARVQALRRRGAMP